MTMGKKTEDLDIDALLAEVHGSSAEDLRDDRITQALNTLEATHRDAARGLRDLHTQGLRRARGLAAELLPAARAVSAQAPASTGPESPEKTAHLSNHDPSWVAAEPTVSAPQPAIAVQSGEGADVAMDHRTLTHIVRPNRGRR